MRVDGFLSGQVHHCAFGAARNRAYNVALRNDPRATGEDEVGERLEFLVQRLDQHLQAVAALGGDDVDAGHRQLAAEIEQVVLHAAKFRKQPVVRLQLHQEHADVGVQFVNRADGVDAGAVLGDPVATGKPGGAGITGAGDDLRQAFAHQNISAGSDSVASAPSRTLCR